jgi:hypothetical protein
MELSVEINEEAAEETGIFARADDARERVRKRRGEEGVVVEELDFGMDLVEALGDTIMELLLEAGKGSSELGF